MKRNNHDNRFIRSIDRSSINFTVHSSISYHYRYHPSSIIPSSTMSFASVIPLDSSSSPLLDAPSSIDSFDSNVDSSCINRHDRSSIPPIEPIVEPIIANFSKSLASNIITAQSQREYQALACTDGRDNSEKHSTASSRGRIVTSPTTIIELTTSHDQPPAPFGHIATAPSSAVDGVTAAAGAVASSSILVSSLHRPPSSPPLPPRVVAASSTLSTNIVPTAATTSGRVYAGAATDLAYMAAGAGGTSDEEEEKKGDRIDSDRPSMASNSRIGTTTSASARARAQAATYDRSARAASRGAASAGGIDGAADDDMVVDDRSTVAATSSSSSRQQSTTHQQHQQSTSSRVRAAAASNIGPNAGGNMRGAATRPAAASLSPLYASIETDLSHLFASSSRVDMLAQPSSSATPQSSISSAATQSASPILIDNACHCLVVDSSRISAVSSLLAELSAAIATNCTVAKRRTHALALLAGVDAADVGHVYELSDQLHINFRSYEGLGRASALHPFLVRCGLSRRSVWSRDAQAGPCGPVLYRLPELINISCIPSATPSAVELESAFASLMEEMNIECTSKTIVTVASRQPRNNQPERIIINIVPRLVLDIAEVLNRHHKQHTLLGSVVTLTAPNRPDLCRCIQCDELGHQSNTCPTFRGLALRLLHRDKVPYSGLEQWVAATGARIGLLGATVGPTAPSRVMTLLFDVDTADGKAIMMSRVGPLIVAQRSSLFREPTIVSTSNRHRECRRCGSNIKEHQCPFASGTPKLYRPGVDQRQQPSASASNRSVLPIVAAPSSSPRAVATSAPHIRRDDRMCRQWRAERKCDRMMRYELCPHQHPDEHRVEKSKSICFDHRDRVCHRGDACRFVHGPTSMVAAPVASSSSSVAVASSSSPAIINASVAVVVAALASSSLTSSSSAVAVSTSSTARIAARASSTTRSSIASSMLVASSVSQSVVDAAPSTPKRIQQRSLDTMQQQRVNAINLSSSSSGATVAATVESSRATTSPFISTPSASPPCTPSKLGSSIKRDRTTTDSIKSFASRIIDSSNADMVASVSSASADDTSPPPNAKRSRVGAKATSSKATRPTGSDEPAASWSSMSSSFPRHANPFDDLDNDDDDDGMSQTMSSSQPSPVTAAVVPGSSLDAISSPHRARSISAAADSLPPVWTASTTRSRGRIDSASSTVAAWSQSTTSTDIVISSSSSSSSSSTTAAPSARRK